MTKATHVLVSLDQLCAMTDMASSHVEDIVEGIREGLYLASENTDLEAKKLCVEQFRAICEASRGLQHGGEERSGVVDFQELITVIADLDGYLREIQVENLDGSEPALEALLKRSGKVRARLLGGSGHGNV